MLLLLCVISLNCSTLITIRVVERDNGSKVHSSLINYPLLFLEAIHKQPLVDDNVHIYSKMGESLVFRKKKKGGSGREEEGNISRLSILFSTGASQSSLEITNA